MTDHAATKHGMTPWEAAELRSLNGLYVGSLSEDELRVFQNAVNAGMARRKYDGASGFLGLSKVELTAAGAPHER